MPEVDGQIDQDEHQPESQYQPLDQGQVAIDDRIDGHIAEPGVGEGEYALDDHRAAQQEGELNAGQGESGQNGVTQGFPPDQRELAITFQPGQQDILLLHGLQPGRISEPGL